jgi:hypothetical protein
MGDTPDKPAAMITDTVNQLHSEYPDVEKILAQTTNVGPGNEKLPHLFEDWPEIRARAANAYGIGNTSEANKQAEVLFNALLPRERSFVFEHVESDSDYRYLHVEPLLDQAAAILDRCIVDRSQRDLYAVEAFKNRVELEQFFKLEDIHDAEIAAGIYTLPFVRSQLDGVAEGQLELWNEAATKELNRIMDKYQDT